MIDYNNHKTNNQERKQAMRNVAQKSEKSISGAIKINEKRDRRPFESACTAVGG